MIKNINLKVKRVDGPVYAIKICNNGDQEYFIEQGALDIFSQNTKMSVRDGRNTIPITCKSLTKVNNTLTKLESNSCLVNKIHREDIKAICAFDKSKYDGHYEIVYETTTALCDSNYLDTQCTSMDLVGSFEYLHYPGPYLM